MPDQNITIHIPDLEAALLAHEHEYLNDSLKTIFHAGWAIIAAHKAAVAEQQAQHEVAVAAV